MSRLRFASEIFLMRYIMMTRFFSITAPTIGSFRSIGQFYPTEAGHYIPGGGANVFKVLLVCTPWFGSDNAIRYLGSYRNNRLGYAIIPPKQLLHGKGFQRFRVLTSQHLR